MVGGGLAGSEAAWALAARGVSVTLYEMRPVRMTPAHQTDRLAELVCSNSFKSVELGNAHGLLKAELRRLGSVVLEAADAARVPGGAALAVDRTAFAQGVHDRVTGHSNITVVRREATELPSPGIVATGPLTSDALAATIARRLDAASLAFFDAIAPIVAADSLDHRQLFRASRYGKGGGDDYLNAPFTEQQYDAFVTALRTGEQYQPHHEFDRTPYFEGCLPVEEMAARGRDVLRFGPMKPVGLKDPRAGARSHSAEPHAVVQLRQEDRAGQMWNLVGFQTRLKIPDQQRVFRMIPASSRLSSCASGASTATRTSIRPAPSRPISPPRTTRCSCSPGSSRGWRGTRSLRRPGYSPGSTSRGCSRARSCCSRHLRRCSARCITTYTRPTRSTFSR